MSKKPSSKSATNTMTIDSSLLSSNPNTRRLPPITSQQRRRSHEVWEGGHKKSITYTSNPLASRSPPKKRNTTSNKGPSISELSVKAMSLHRLPSSAWAATKQAADNLFRRASKKKSKPSAQALYTSKAIESYKSKAETGDPMALLQYRQDLLQQNIQKFRDHWKARPITKHREDSDVSLVDVKESSVVFPRTRRKHKKLHARLNVRPKKASFPRLRSERGVSTATIGSNQEQQSSQQSSQLSSQLSSQQSSQRSSQRSSQMSSRIGSLRFSSHSVPVKKSGASMSSSISFTAKRLGKIMQRKQAQETRVQLVNRSLQQFRRFQVPGVRAIKLTNSTQNFLGLKTKLDLENPWFCMEVEDLLDNIKFVKKYSEALKVLELVVPYTEPEMLIGYFPYPSMFLVCATPEAKDMVITMLEDDLMHALSTLETKLCRTPFRWLSFGSEREIDDQTLNLETLCQVRISIVCPLVYQEKTRFKMRYVQEARDGYVEVLTLRRTYNNVYRCKLDASTQTNKSNISVGTAIGNKVLKNRGTQYTFHYPKISLSKQQDARLMLFLKQEYKNIVQTLTENNFMRIYSNDYPKTNQKEIDEPEAPSPSPSSSAAAARSLQFWEPKYCKNKTVLQVVWNPWITGNIAVVYSEVSGVVSQETFENTNVNEENYVLIWTYNNEDNPDQYLFSEKVVTTVSFCPADKKIIIGGTETGDILVWLLPDIDEKHHKPPGIFTENMYNNRSLMASMSAWIKNLQDPAIIKVKGFSSTRFCHLGQVTCLTWLLPGYKFTTSGQLLSVAEGEEKFPQFFSCGVDGHVFIWDVPRMIFAVNGSTMGSRRRMDNAQRYANILRDKTLIPRYKMKISLSSIPNCLVSVQIPNQRVIFDAIRQRSTGETLFASMDDPTNQKYSTGMYLATYFGGVIWATWDRYEIVLREKNENLQVSRIVHDGPITSFEVHPLAADLVLSVGGKIFAVWYMRKMEAPVLWRRRPMDLVSGFWSRANAEELTVATFDGKLETWNFLHGERTPARTVNITRYPIAGLFNEISTEHAHKNSLVVADYFGICKVFWTPKENPREECSRRELVRKVRHIFKQRDVFKEVLAAKKPLKAEEEPVAEKLEVAVRDPIRRSRKITRFSKNLTEILGSKPPAKERPTKEMRQQKIERQKEKKLQQNVEALKKKIFKSTAQQMNQMDQEGVKENQPCLELNPDNRQKILEEKIKTRHDVINLKVQNILSLVNTNIPRKLPADVPSQKETITRVLLKKHYLEEYKNMETPILNFIKWNEYDEELNWMDYIDKGRHRTTSAVTLIDTIIDRSSSTIDCSVAVD